MSPSLDDVRPMVSDADQYRMSDLTISFRSSFIMLQRQDELHQIALENSLQPVSRNQAAVRAMTRRYTVASPNQLMKRLTVKTNELMNMGALDPQL